MNTLKEESAMEHQHSITSNDCSSLFNNKLSDKSLTHKKQLLNTSARGCQKGSKNKHEANVSRITFAYHQGQGEI